MTNENHGDIQALRTAARDRDQDDPRWRALAKGRLSEAEEEKLRADYPSEEGRALYEIYRPFDADEKRRLLEGVQARVRAERARHRKLVYTRVVASAAMAAAAAGVYVRATEAPEVQVALSTVRGSAEQEVLASPESPFKLIIVPTRPIKRDLTVRGTLLVHVQDGQPRAWAPHPNPPADDKAVVIAGSKKEVFACVPSGTWDLYIAVGLPGEAIPASEMIRLADKGSAGAYQVLKKRVVLDGERLDADGQPCRDGAR
jgi:hypothetical protein